MDTTSQTDVHIMDSNTIECEYLSNLINRNIERKSEYIPMHCFYNITKIQNSIGTGKFFTDANRCTIGFVLNNSDLHPNVNFISMLIPYSKIQLIEMVDTFTEDGVVIYKILTPRQDVYIAVPVCISIEDIMTYSNVPHGEYKSLLEFVL